MKRTTVTSTTALVLGLAMSPAMAQNSPFPCGIAEGGTVDSAEAFATYLIAERAAGSEIVLDDPALCGPRAARQAKRAADGALEDLDVPRGNGRNAEGRDATEDDTSEPNATPEMEAEIDATEPAAEVAVPPAQEKQDPVDEAAVAPAADPAAAAAEAPLDAENAADPAADAAADAAPAPVVEPSTDPAPEPVPETAAEAGADPAAEAAMEPAAEAASDPAAEAAAEPAADDAAAPADPAASEPVAPEASLPAVSAEADPAEPASAETAEPDAAAASAPESTEEMATEDADVSTEMSDADLAAQLDAQGASDSEAEAGAEVPAPAPEANADDNQGRIGANTAADSSVPPAEDARGSNVEGQTSAESALPPELTPEQRARREARRAERAAARQASAAAQADAAPAETETEELTQDDVRQASEDFQSRVLGDGAEVSDADEDGLSNFEKAILLGLGAATVGALLNNGDEVVSNSGDRLIVEREGELRVLKDDNALLRQPGAQVQTQTFDDGSTLTTVTRENGSVVRTVRSADGTVLRRTLVRTDGTEVALIDDLDETSAPVDVASLPAVSTRSPATLASSDDAALQRALTAQLLANTERTYSLEQVRGIQEVRELAAPVELDTVTFATGSAAIQPSQAEELGALGRAIRDVIAESPAAIFLIEGHTDAVGDAAYNLGLSDRRAETVALALTQYFDVPPENLVTQGYGEQFLKVRTLEAERANRRAAVRNVTGLLRDS